MNACPYCGAPMTTAEHKCEWRLEMNADDLSRIQEKDDRAAQVWDELCECEAISNQDAKDKQVAIIAAYGQEQRRAGIEAMRKANCQCYHQTTFTCSVCRQAKQLAEQEGKG